MTTVTATAVTPTVSEAGAGRPIAWWGMTTLIMTESTIFAGLLAANFFLRAAAKQWPPAGVEPPELSTAIVFSLVLWGSSVPVAWAERGIARGRLGVLRAGLALGFVMGAAFLVHTALEFNALPFGWRDHAYGSVFYATVGLHAIHLLIGLVMNAVVQVKAWKGRVTAERHLTVQVFSMYWHFVDAVWIFVFGALFVGAHIR